MKTNINKDNLGQVFTDKNVVKYMVGLFSRKLNNSSEILDPCIGENIFLKEISKYVYKNLTGVEVDNDLITNETKKFFKSPNHRLIIQNFFDFEEKKFDFIVMNPPYVRHELLKDGEVNSKTKIFSKISDKNTLIPKKSNLYVYYIIKALSYLKKNGELIAIIYDSWLYTDFGKYFKKYIIEKYNLSEIIHLKNGAFDKINVGASIVVIKKMKQKKTINYKLFNNTNDFNQIKFSKKLKIKELLDFYEKDLTEINFDSKIFTCIENISDEKISRGVNAKINKFFLFDTNKFPGYTEKIIKKVNNISDFSVKDTKHHILITKEKLTHDIEKYLTKIKKLILTENKYNVLKKSISEKKDWHKIVPTDPGTVIFNYYFRNNTDFIYNQNRLHVSDNFYNLYISENFFANFAILNSTLSKISLIKNSKSQGNGLRKIQLNKFREIKIVDINKLNKNEMVKISNLGKKLMDCNRKNNLLIDKIDSILISFLENNNCIDTKTTNLKLIYSNLING